MDIRSMSLQELLQFKDATELRIRIANRNRIVDSIFPAWYHHDIALLESIQQEIQFKAEREVVA